MIQWFLGRPVTVLMLIVTILVLGAIGAQRIPLRLLPDYELAQLSVFTRYPGANAVEMEEEVTEPLERGLATIPGLTKMQSRSRFGNSEIRLEFRANTQIKEIFSIIKDRLDLVNLPEGASKPIVKRTIVDKRPLMEILISSPSAEGTSEEARQKELYETANTIDRGLRRELELIDGVAVAEMKGAPKRKAVLNVDHLVLLGRGISAQDIGESVTQRSKWQSVGSILNDGKNLNVKIGSPYRNLDDLTAAPMAINQNRFAPISEFVTPNTKIEESASAIVVDGQQALLIEVYREGEANAVEVARRVRDYIQSMVNASPKLTILSDQGQEIESAIDNIKTTVIGGAIMAAFVIYILIQSPWPAFVVTVIIPLSLALTFVLMQLFGITFNLMSLAGLALGVGMLVDNSTVVLESINDQRKKLTDLREAALLGTNQVLGAITASTFCTLAVFIPLMFVHGAIGLYFRDIAKTVSISLVSSLLLSLIIIPFLTIFDVDKLFVRSVYKRVLLPSGEKLHANAIRSFALFLWVAQETIRWIKWILGTILSKIQSGFSKVERQYLQHGLEQIERLFKLSEIWILRNIDRTFQFGIRARWLAMSVVLLGAILIYDRGSELFPDEAVGRIEFQIETPGDFPAEKTKSIFSRAVAAVEPIKMESRLTLIRDEETPSQARLIVEHHLSNSAAEDLAATAAHALAGVDNLTHQRMSRSLMGSEPPILIEIFGSPQDTDLRNRTTNLVEKLKTLDYLRDVRWLGGAMHGEARIEMNRLSLAAAGVDSSAFAKVLSELFIKKSLGIFKFSGQSLPLEVAAKSSTFSTLPGLPQVGLEVDEGKRIFLGDVAKVKLVESPSEVYRTDRRPLLAVQSYLNNTSLGEAVAKLEKQIQKWQGESRLEYRISGQNSARVESFMQLAIAFVFSILIIFVILASQFESLTQPLIVLLAVPFCTLGVAIFLAMFGLVVSATVMVGGILLIGISVNTSIIMVDLANRLLAEGKSAKEAIVEAARVRSKPILVTTFANILGLVPMLFTGGEPGGSLQLPMAATLVGGLVSSTVLTLILLPMIYVGLTSSKKSVG